MPDLTPRLGIKKPLGNENVTRENFNENWDIIDLNSAKKIDLARHQADTTQQKHVMVSDTPPQNQGTGGIWFQTGLGEVSNPGGGGLVLQNAIVSDDPPGDTKLIWMDT
ncbi:MAG: hypothetical protein ACQEW2_10780 [Bacillota bacterium]